MLDLVLLSTIAGVFGIGIGGVIGAIFGSRSERVLCTVLSFAAGVMISMVSFSLVPEAVEISNVWNAGLGIAFGILILSVMDSFVHSITSTHKKTQSSATLGVDALRKKSLYKAGITMLCALAFHNLPEGIALGSSGAHNIGLGFGIAALLMLHNIPSGMAISAPLIGGGMKKLPAVLLSALSGLTTVIGAVIGFRIGGIDPFVTAFCIASAAGAMLYVVFGEIIPQSISMQKGKFPTFILLFGVIFGLFVTSMI